MKNNNKLLSASDELNLKKDNEDEHAKANNSEIINKERVPYEKMALREREFSSIMVRASAAIAEHRTKSKLINAFQKGIVSHAEKIAQFNTEISNLESRIDHLLNEIEPIDEKINRLEDDINKHVFLYKDKNSSINNICIEIESILFEYSKKIKSDGFENIVSDKKSSLRRMCEDIENLEIRITTMELEKLSRQNDIQPSVDEIKILSLQLQYLKNESTQKELLGLLSITGNAIDAYDETHEEKQDTDPKVINNLSPH